MDEMVSGHKRGQSASVFEKGSALVPDLGAGKKCARCPKYELRKLWCSVRAEQRPPAAPACHYGIGIMGDTIQKEQLNAKTSS